MYDRMKPIPFKALLTLTLKGIGKREVFGVKGPSTHIRNTIGYHGEKLGLAFGPAAGPHTQLAQNIIISYYSGARFFELKTLQKMAGEALHVEKPCILADDEGYNVEWSSELTVKEAMEEYIKAWVILKIIAREYNFSRYDEFIFNVSVGYTLEGIKSDSIDMFLEGLKDATTTDIWRECIDACLSVSDQFINVDKTYIENISSRIVRSVALSTMHGAKPSEIEGIAQYLMEQKGLHCVIKLNPTLLGPQTVRTLLDHQGYKNIVFNEKHFEDDLQFDDAIAMIDRLQKASKKIGLEFGVKLTNTFPVKIQKSELPGEEMYLSGKALYPLSLSVALKLAQAFDGKISISYSGGVDQHTINDILKTGIYPITICTTLLKTGGYYRLKECAIKSSLIDIPQTISTQRIQCLLDNVLESPHYKRRKSKVVKIDSKIPLHQCGIAPCEGICPIDQRIEDYIMLRREGEYLKAFEVILEDNALIGITAQTCYARCEKGCRRHFYDEHVGIRDIKMDIFNRAYEDYMNAMSFATKPGLLPVHIIGAGVSGMSAAYYFRREGHEVNIYDAESLAGGILRTMVKKVRDEPKYLDMDIARLKKMGIVFHLAQNITSVETFRGIVILATGNRKYQMKLSSDRSELICDVNHYEIGDRVKEKVSSIVECMADAKMLYEKFHHYTHSKKPKPKMLFNNKAKIILKSDLAREPNRCLSCQSVCENCIDVCPNRANVPIKIKNFKQREILHIHDFCNECGNCTTFCPYNGDPYKEKMSLVSNYDEYVNTKAPVFYFDDEKIYYKTDKECIVPRDKLYLFNEPNKSIIAYAIEHFEFLKG